MNDTQQLLQKSIARAKRGQHTEARQILHRLVKQEPRSEVAWLWLAGLSATREEACESLDRVRQLNPANPHLVKAQAWSDRRFGTPSRPGAGSTPASPEKGSAAETPSRQTKAYSVAERIALAGLAGALVAILGATALTLTLPVGNAVQLLPAAVRAALPWPLPPGEAPSAAVARLVSDLEQAQARRDYPAMIDRLEQMHQADPGNADIASLLEQTYLAQGMILRNSGNYDRARESFKRALAPNPAAAVAQQQLELITLYQAGMRLHQQGQWSEALSVLSQVFEQDPTFPFITEILYSAYFNQGLAHEAATDWTAALASFEAGAALLPRPEVEQKIAGVKLQLQPPTAVPTLTATPEPVSTPASSQQRVVVDISDQRAYTYEGQTLVHEFVVSTGAPGRDTAIGEFEIQNKLPLAYASTWNLDMPFWLGIYWSGPLQNGFHALPTVRHTGQTMWDGYLGQRVSYGCVILGEDDAKTLYDWVKVGTPVSIVW
jgi:tetratricopeptide (TPR) repeat protein